MPWFNYNAMDGQGNHMEGKIAGTDIPTVTQTLTDKGYIGVTVTALGKQGRIGKAAPRELAVLAQQFAVIIRSDITLDDGVETLILQTENRHIKTALAQVRLEIQQGNSFAEAMSKHKEVFPAYYRSMIRIGEISGSLDGAFERLADYYEKEHKLNRKVRTAVTYPIILSVMMLGVIALLVVKVLPMFSDILSGLGGQMPALTVAILGMSDFFANYGWWVLLAVLLLALLPNLIRMTAQGEQWYDKYLLNQAILGKIRKRLINARFCHSFALLLRSGVSVTVALSMVSDLLGNHYVSGQLQACIKAVEKGDNLADALEATGLFPALMLRMVHVGEKTGRLDDILMNSAVLFDEELDSALDRMTSSIEPALIILLSIIVGVILFAIMLPMINILSVI